MGLTAAEQRTLYPAARVATVVRREMERAGMSIVDLAKLSGVNDRQIRLILSGGQAKVTERKVDLLLVALDCVELLYVRPEHGGLGDITEAQLQSVAA